MFLLSSLDCLSEFVMVKTGGRDLATGQFRECSRSATKAGFPREPIRWTHSEQLPKTLQGLLLDGQGGVAAAVRQHRQVLRRHGDDPVLQQGKDGLGQRSKVRILCCPLYQKVLQLLWLAQKVSWTTASFLLDHGFLELKQRFLLAQKVSWTTARFLLASMVSLQYLNDLIGILCTLHIGLTIKSLSKEIKTNHIYHNY